MQNKANDFYRTELKEGLSLMEENSGLTNTFLPNLWRV